MTRHLTVRAVDVGYGHVKLSNGRDPQTGLLLTEAFPSQSPASRKSALHSKVLSQRDTFIISLGDRHYEVGKDVDMAVEANHESEILDQDFPLSDAYAARLFGALNYMYPDLPDQILDYLVLGLPMTTIRKHASVLQKRFTGKQVINANGDTLQINHVEVFPQPLGSYSAYLAANPPLPGKPMPKALVVDPGYNTVDWFVIRGMKASDTKSGAAIRGMGSVLGTIAEKLALPVEQGGAKGAQRSNPKEIVRLIDQALTRGEPLVMCGNLVNLDDYLDAGNAIIEEAAQAVSNSVGGGIEIDLVIMTGGGAGMYTNAITAKFADHRVVTLDEAAFANVRGFHFLGERLARSAERAAMGAAQVPA